MKLGEVLKKRDYHKGCLLEVTELIKQSLVANDKYTDKEYKDRVSVLLQQFTDHYNSYQRYSILASRSESNTMIPIDDESDISIRDVSMIKETMVLRYNCFKSILDKLINHNGSSVCIDVDILSNVLLNFHEEIMGMEIKIEKALWTSEVV